MNYVAMLDDIKVFIDRSLMSDYQIAKILSGRHTVTERAIALQMIEEQDIVMELGGGLGTVAIAAAKKIGGERVYSYEPNPELTPLIERNCRLNQVQPHFKTYLLGPRTKKILFYQDRNFSRSSIHQDRATKRIVELPCVDFNIEVQKIRPTFVICDIQGAEVELFEYADFSSIQKLVIEFHPRIVGAAKCRILLKQALDWGFKAVYRRRNCWGLIK